MFLSESKFFQVYCEQKNFFYTKIRIFKMRNVKTTYKVKKILKKGEFLKNVNNIYKVDNTLYNNSNSNETNGKKRNRTASTI